MSDDQYAEYVSVPVWALVRIVDLYDGGDTTVYPDAERALAELKNAVLYRDPGLDTPVPGDLIDGDGRS